MSLEKGDGSRISKPRIISSSPAFSIGAIEPSSQQSQ